MSPSSWRTTSPATAVPAPRRASRNSSWPCPSSPATPTSSPARISTSNGLLLARSRSPLTLSDGRAAPPCRWRRLFAGVLGELVRSGHQADELSRRPVPALERRHRLARAHHRDPVPDLADLVHPVRDEDRRRRLRCSAGATIRNSRSRVATSSAEVASSRIRMRGAPHQRAHDAARLAVAQRQLLHRRVECRAAGRAAPRAPRSARARFSRTGMRLRTAPSTPSQTLSSTERASATRTSWKTVTMPQRLRGAG